VTACSAQFCGLNASTKLVHHQRFDAEYLGDLPSNTLPWNGAPCFDHKYRAWSDRGETSKLSNTEKALGSKLA
jgi:hypothetical protein